MTDLEMTKLCAEAAEVWKIAHEWYPTMTLDATFKGVEIRGDACYLVPTNPMRQDPKIYQPLHDDTQAMALVKKFTLHISRSDKWWIAFCPNGADSGFTGDNPDLNRAIVECVAKMQVAKAAV